MEYSFIKCDSCIPPCKTLQDYQSNGRSVAEHGLLTAFIANSWDMKRAQILAVKIYL